MLIHLHFLSYHCLCPVNDEVCLIPSLVRSPSCFGRRSPVQGCVLGSDYVTRWQARGLETLFKKINTKLILCQWLILTEPLPFWSTLSWRNWCFIDFFFPIHYGIQSGENETKRQERSCQRKEWWRQKGKRKKTDKNEENGSERVGAGALARRTSQSGPHVSPELVPAHTDVSLLWTLTSGPGCLSEFHA